MEKTNFDTNNIINNSIESVANDKIKYLKKLIDSSAFRKSEGFFVIQTEKIINHAYKNNIIIKSIYFTKKELDKNYDNICMYKTKNINCILISDICAEKISDFKSPQGFFALCEKPKNFESIDKYEDTDIILNIKDKKQRIIALDNVQDPGNLGTIIRTALAFGFDCAFLSSNCVDLFSSKVIRATMGAFFGYNIICCENLTKDLNHLKNSGFTIYGTLLDNEAKNLKEIVFAKKSVIIIGNEGHGISENIKNICDEKIYIPMKPFKGQIQSLNAASAASVVMWEASK